MIRDEQEFVVVHSVATKKYMASSTSPRWTRKLEALERLGLARRRRTITAVENGERKVLGGEWELDEERVALRLTPRRRATAAQRQAAAKATATRVGRRANARAFVKNRSVSRGDSRATADEPRVMMKPVTTVKPDAISRDVGKGTAPSAADRRAGMERRR